jgi:hypothetical protein
MTQNITKKRQKYTKLIHSMNSNDFNQKMSSTLNTIGHNQKAMDEIMKTLAKNVKKLVDNQKAMAYSQQTMADIQKAMADNQKTMAEDITSLIVCSKRQDAILKCMASQFENTNPACSLVSKINNILDVDKNPV